MASPAIPPSRSPERLPTSPFRSVVYSGEVTTNSTAVIIKAISSSARKKLQPAVQILRDTITGNRLYRAQELYLKGCDYLDEIKDQKGLLHKDVDVVIASKAVECFGEAYLTDYQGFVIDQATSFWISSLLKQLPTSLNRHLVHVTNGMVLTVAYLTTRDQLEAFMKSKPSTPKAHSSVELTRESLAGTAQTLLQSFKTAAELDCQDPRVQKVYGHALATCGQYGAAIKQLEKALALASQLPAEDPRCVQPRGKCSLLSPAGSQSQALQAP
jgi:hypothetical protein